MAASRCAQPPAAPARAATCRNRTGPGSARRARRPERQTREWSKTALDGRQPQREARAQNPRRFVVRGRHRCAVLGPELAAMGIDDLLGNRKPKAGVLAEALLRPVGVEALENFVEGLRT